MIPTRAQCLLLFDRYNLPSQKRIHVEVVTEFAKYLARNLKTQNPKLKINKELLESACLLHDIDKNISRSEGERHPDTAVRILRELGYSEVASIIATHSLHCILDPKTAPESWEAKILYLADKMTKYEVIGVDHRFKLWYRENLPSAAILELKACYPLVKALEKELLAACGITISDLKQEFGGKSY